MKKLTIKVEPKYVRELNDPSVEKHNTIYAFVPITSLPEFPLDINPRKADLHSRVAREIVRGLLEESRHFHLLNRGLTLTTSNAVYDGRKKELILEFANKSYGLLDGGHTYNVIREQITRAQEELEKIKKEATDPSSVVLPDFLNSFVKLEVINGVEDELVFDLAESRNTSSQVKEQSLLNLEGSFDWLKKAFKGETFASKIAYRENEDDAIYPIDVREIVCLLTCFHPAYKDADHPPMIAYSGRNKCLDLFRDSEGQKGFRALEPIASEILKMYDYIHFLMPSFYEKIGGIMGTAEEDKRKTKTTKLAKVVGIKQFKEGIPLYYVDQKIEFRFSDGWLFPILSSLRAICDYSDAKEVRWKTNPKKFLESIGETLVRLTLDTSKAVGRRPTAVGKARAHWIGLYNAVSTAYFKQLDAEKLAKAA